MDFAITWALAGPNSPEVLGDTLVVLSGGALVNPLTSTAPVGTLSASFTGVAEEDPANPYIITVQPFDTSSPPVPKGVALSKAGPFRTPVIGTPTASDLSVSVV